MNEQILERRDTRNIGGLQTNGFLAAFDICGVEHHFLQERLRRTMLISFGHVSSPRRGV
jgi:hypothetical protein